LLHGILVDFLSFLFDDAVGVFVPHLIFLVIAAALGSILAADECSHLSEEAIRPESTQKYLRINLDLIFSLLSSRNNR
jgi:hypothetical protein